MYFYRMILSIPYTNRINNILKLMAIKYHIHRIRTKSLKFVGYIMRKRDLGNLTLTGNIEDMKDKRRQEATYLMCIC